MISDLYKIYAVIEILPTYFSWVDRKELQTRLIKFSVNSINLASSITENIAMKNLAGQLVKSSSSPALNYAESQSAESTKDFVHKLGIVLKELRETSVCLRILNETGLCQNKELLSLLQLECHELEAIFTSSIKTMKLRDQSPMQ